MLLSPALYLHYCHFVVASLFYNPFIVNFLLNIYLDPVGIPKGERFSWNQATSNEIKKRNPELNSSRLKYDAFCTHFFRQNSLSVLLFVNNLFK